MIAALLIAEVIALGVHNPVPSNSVNIHEPRIADRGTVEAKVRDVYLGVRENISVLRETPKYYIFFPRLNVQNILWSNRSSASALGLSGDYAAEGSALGADYSVPDFSRIVSEGIRWREVCVENLATRIVIKTFSGSITGVSPSRPEPPVITFLSLNYIGEWPVTLARYVGTLSRDHRLFGNGYVFGGGFLGANQKPDLNAADPGQNQRERGEAFRPISDRLRGQILKALGGGFLLTCCILGGALYLSRWPNNDCHSRDSEGSKRCKW